MLASRVAVAVALAITSAPVLAQPSAALGKPLPSPDLATGTIAVRVVDGTPSAPHANLEVTLAIAGESRKATTDAAGRATFDHVKVGASVKVSIATTEPTGTSETFVVPSDGGTRVMLSTAPWQASGSGPPPRTQRSISGMPMAEESVPAGTAEVKLTYDDLADKNPPAGVSVSLVGYVADAHVTVVAAKTDRTGVARFTGLDPSGATAYFAIAQLPRKGAADRLMSQPFTIDKFGMRITLAAEQRTATAPPVDELVTLAQQTKLVAPAKGKARIVLEGAFEKTTPVELLDAATGKVVTKGVATGNELVVAVTDRRGQVLYAEAIARDKRYRSLPFQTVADRGAAVTVYIYPQILDTFTLLAEPDDDLLRVGGKIAISNNAWIPYAEPGGVKVPLPRGAQKADVSDDEDVTVKGNDLVFSRPLAPGAHAFNVGFQIPATAGSVDWSLDLPYGSYQSSFYVTKEPGVTLKAPSSVTVETKTLPGGTFLGIPQITIVPKYSMTMTITLPKPGKDAALWHACRDLAPDRSSAFLGKPMPEFELAQLDGKKLRLSSLRGTPVLVNLTATWNGVSKPEQPKLAALAKEVAGLAVVVVASDRDPKEVAAMVGPKPAFRVVLDPPAKPDDVIGVVTASWGVSALPESFLVDRHGVLRFYFPNTRDWDSAAARACVKAVVAIP